MSGCEREEAERSCVGGAAGTRGWSGQSPAATASHAPRPQADPALGLLSEPPGSKQNRPTLSQQHRKLDARCCLFGLARRECMQSPYLHPALSLARREKIIALGCRQDTSIRKSVISCQQTVSAKQFARGTRGIEEWIQRVRSEAGTDKERCERQTKRERTREEQRQSEEAKSREPPPHA